VARFEDSFDVCGPVQAEIFMLWRNGDHVELTGPCGAAPWYVEVGQAEDPVEVVARMVSDVVGPPRLVHSTSWRRDRDGVILSFVVVIDPDQAVAMPTTSIERAELARSDAVRAPATIASSQVIEHGLRHLSWLLADDPVVARELDGNWAALLASYTPEPFRNLR
jgi:hypothetical protein